MDAYLAKLMSERIGGALRHYQDKGVVGSTEGPDGFKR